MRTFAQEQLACGGIERGEQLIGHVGARLDQRIEQGRLAGIGIADQRNVEGFAPLALAALRTALTPHFRQSLAGAPYRVADHSAVQLDLRFAGAAAPADATALTLQVRPAAHQPGAQVLQARQFDLQLALVTSRTLREDLEDEEGAVVNRHAGMTFQISLLRWTTAPDRTRSRLHDAVRPKPSVPRPCRAQQKVPHPAPCACTPALPPAASRRSARAGQVPQVGCRNAAIRNQRRPGRLRPARAESTRAKWAQCHACAQPARAAAHWNQAPVSASAAWKLTARPGTMVEMACL